MKCRYKSILQQADNVKVEVTTGEYCADLPAEKTKVMVEYYPAIGKSVVTASNMLKKAKHFKNADDLVCYLLDWTIVNKVDRRREKSQKRVWIMMRKTDQKSE